MKKKIYFLLLIIFITSCKKEETKPEYKYQFHVSPPTIGYNYETNHPGIEGAKIEIFDSENNFNISQTPIKTLNTDLNGDALVTFNEAKKIWFKIRKDTLSNLRSGYTNSEVKRSNLPIENSLGYLGFINASNNSTNIYCMLSSTPTKLKIQAFKSGVVQVNKKVRLFLSEADLINRTNLDYENGNLEIQPKYLAYGRTLILSAILETTTDSQGYATFNNLEPRKKYWFSVDDKVPTPNNTDTPLEESNLDVPREIQVVVP